MVRTRLTREESAKCKLTDDDIESIIRMRWKWMTFANIAKLFKVSMPTIWRHCNPEKAYEYNKKQWEKRKKEWYYDKNWMRKKLRIASKNTANKKRKIIPWYAEYIDNEAHKRRAIRHLEKQYN